MKSGVVVVGTETCLNRGKKEKEAETPYLHCTETHMQTLITTHQEEDEPDHPESIVAAKDPGTDKPVEIAEKGRIRDSQK